MDTRSSRNGLWIAVDGSAPSCCCHTSHRIQLVDTVTLVEGILDPYVQLADVIPSSKQTTLTVGLILHTR